MSIGDRDYHLRTFEDLLYDSVYLLYFAFDTNPDDYEDDVIGSFIRSSILNSVLLLECGANCLIDSMDLPKKYYNDIEKLPFLSKFEYFLERVNDNHSFDRGCSEVQCVADLKIIRDRYVHPNVKKIKPVKISEDQWVINFSNTKHLKFPYNPASWSRDHAILAIKSVNNFYNKYFLEWCGLESDAVIDLLLSGDKANIEAPTGGTIDCVGGLDRAVREWKVDFKFIGKKI